MENKAQLIEEIEHYDSLNTQTQERIRFIVRGLLQNTFLVRDKDNVARRDFDILRRNSGIVADMLDFFGYHLTIDADVGVARVSCEEDSCVTRYPLTGLSAVLLCVIWAIYRDKMDDGGLSRYITIQTSDILSALDRYGIRNRFGGTSYQDTMKVFKRFSLIGYEGDIRDPECFIHLYASLQFCLSDKDFIGYYNEVVSERLKHSADVETEESVDEEADEI